MKKFASLVFLLSLLPFNAVAQDSATGDKRLNESALEALRRNAEAGNPQSQYQLAVHYLNSKETPQGDAEALAWLRKAANAGHGASQVSLGAIYREGSRGISKDSAEAVNWFRKAAESGNAQGQSELGFMYERGEGVPKDEAEAVRWYSLAAAQGLPIARFDLAFMYEEGRGVPKDVPQAAKLYELAAMPIRTARYNLAILYFEGDSFPQDLVQAYKWCLLTISMDSNRILTGTADPTKSDLGHALLLAKKISNKMNKGDKEEARTLAKQWIQAHSNELGDEPKHFDLAVSNLK